MTTLINSVDLIAKIQSWYKSMCNDDWSYTYSHAYETDGRLATVTYPAGTHRDTWPNAHSQPCGGGVCLERTVDRQGWREPSPPWMGSRACPSQVDFFPAGREPECKRAEPPMDGFTGVSEPGRTFPAVRISVQRAEPQSSEARPHQTDSSRCTKPMI